MSKTTVADYLVQKLSKLGIEEIFGLPGDFNFELVEAVMNNNNINWIGCTNELNASYAADGYARIKGYGAVITTFGVGELSAINGIAGCMAENVPVIQITGVPAIYNIENKIRLHHNLADVDYYAFEKAYSNVVEATAFLNKNNAKAEIDRILNVMVITKRPVYIAIPMDVSVMEIENSDITFIEPKSDEKNLKQAVENIIYEIEKSKNPVVLADILTKRFNAKKQVNDFLAKTKIPSCCFPRGIDVINSSIKNYLGVYAPKWENEICYNLINTSDCIIAIGTVVSDLNTFNFNFEFNIDNHIVIQPNYVTIKEKKYDNILINDVIKLLTEKITYVSAENLVRTFKYPAAKIDKEIPLTSDYIYPRLAEFLKKDDILLTEVGLTPTGVIPIEFPDNINVINQMLWGSIGWATPCCEGAKMAAKNKRTILLTGDGSHQLTAQEVSTMMRNKLKPIIFVFNNSGYTIERLLCDDVDYSYNDIAKWDYSKLPEVFEGECFVKKITINVEFDNILKQIEKNPDKMYYIELILDYLDIPKLALNSAKNPQIFKQKDSI